MDGRPRPRHEEKEDNPQVALSEVTSPHQYARTVATDSAQNLRLFLPTAANPKSGIYVNYRQPR